MGLHKPFDRSFFVIGGATMNQGFSLNLAKGQFGVFDVQDTTVNGARAVNTFLGRPKTRKYEIKVGKTDLDVTRSQSNKSFSTFPFSLNNVLDLQVSAPERTEQSVDDVVIGYNGIDDNTAFSFKKGDSYKIYLELKGEAIGMMGYNHNTVTIPVYLDAESCSALENCVDCDPCESVEAYPIVLRAIEMLKDHQLRGGRKLTEFVDILPVRECDTAPTVNELPYNFFSLDILDTGDETALALVQAQYPNVKIVRTKRNGATSTYEFVQAGTEADPSDFQQTLPSLIKGCQDCPSGYTEVEGGLIYAVTLEDDGADLSTDVENLNNAVGGTVVKSNSQNNGVGYYTVVASAEITTSDIEDFVANYPTATVDFVGESVSICENGTVTTTAWVQGDTCTVSEKEYEIVLPDNECGQDRLEELQQAYPNLTIEIATETTDVLPINVTGGCQTKYVTSVPTNMVCDECDPIFKDYYTSEAPESYDTKMWVEVSNTEEPTGCKTGIRVRGKVIEIHPDECLRDELGFVDSSVMVRLSGGHVTEVREGIGSTEDRPFAVSYLTRYERRTHLGGNLFADEDANRMFFSGEARHYNNNVAKLLKGEESHLQSDKQYVDYALTVRRDYYSQSFAGRSEDNVTYHVLVEVGRHEAVEEILNNLAAAAGINTVKAFGR